LAAVVVLVAVGATIKYTLDLRRERAAAEFRRKQSDEHIEFMVEELYKRLEPVGRVDILEDVGLKALEYFETLREAEKTDDDRARLGRTWSQIGQVRVTSGGYDEAREAFERSLAIHRNLVAQDPLRGDWQIGLSGAHFGIANIAWLTDDMDLAERHFERYLEISKTLISIDPENPTYQLELGFAWTNMAGLHYQTGETERAVEELEQAALVKRQLVACEPENRDARVSLANTLSWLFQIMLDREDYEAALGYSEEALALRRDLAQDERDAEAQEHLGIALQQIGAVLTELGRDEEAERAYREDIAISGRLSQLDPDNPQWQHGLAVSWDSLGEFYVDKGHLDKARPLFENSLRITRSLVELQPDDRDWREAFENARYYMALLEFEQGNPQRALRTLEQGRASEDASSQLDEWILLGRIHSRLGDRAAAADALERATALLKDQPSEERSLQISNLRKEIGG
jgi:serine/threonine-protein kinase